MEQNVKDTSVKTNDYIRLSNDLIRIEFLDLWNSNYQQRTEN